MSDDATKTGDGWLPERGKDRSAREEPTLVLLWAASEPGRVGESGRIPRGASVLGRGRGDDADARARIRFAPARPGDAPSPKPLSGSGLSRVQLELRNVDGVVAAKNVGRHPLVRNGRKEDGEIVLREGDVVEIERQACFLLVLRDAATFRARSAPPGFAFGDADPFGMVGESPAAWTLRDHVDFAAKRPGHVLVVGPSGAGKELAARAVHALSPRASGPFIARNAATLPSGIVDAEIFGHAKNYPNAGMPDRVGLVGEAAGGTLFLDEIGELSQDVQAHLLRVLDDGEYHRLGESNARRADVRLVGATNRDEAALKHDLAARLTLKVSVPSLNERREDVPLLARALLRRAAAKDPAIRDLVFDPATGEPRLDPELIVALVRHEWSTEVREMEALLMESLRESRRGFLELVPSLREKLHPARKDAPPTAEEIERALARAQGNASRAWEELGLSSRDALYRLMRKYGMRKGG